MRCKNPDLPEATEKGKEPARKKRSPTIEWSSEACNIRGRKSHGFNLGF